MLLSTQISFIKLMLKYQSEKEAHDNIGHYIYAVIRLIFN